MKVIDLLNKIAKGEEVPKKIKCDGVIYNYEFQNTITGAYEYRSQNYKCLMDNMAGHLYLTDILNSEAEIIEEEKEISKITKEEFERLDKRTLLELIVKNQNELIAEVNRLKNK